MAEGGSVAFDVEAWPLVIMTCGGNMEGTVGPIRAFFETAHARRERFAIMVDTRPVRSMPGPKWRRELTEWTGDPAVQLNSAQYNVATAVVLSSALARGVYTALGWLWKPASPVKACATPTEAIDWCCDLLMKARVPRSPKLIELQQRPYSESGGASHPSARQSR